MQIAVAYLLSIAAAAPNQPLHSRIDAQILAKAGSQPVAPTCDDAEFVRRIHLDLAGRIPSVAETVAFLDDKSADKRTKLIDKLLASPEYAKRMQELFHVTLMERLGDNADWSNYLQTSFAANKPWDKLAHEILAGNTVKGGEKGAGFFYAKRLEHYGENPIDYPGLTRDVGRLFLGMDLQCAQCHDHRSIQDYRQKDFQGLFAVYSNMTLADAKNMSVGEKLMTGKLAYASVFTKVPKEVGPRIPGMPEIEIPVFKKGEEFTVAPNPKTRTAGIPKFSPVAALAEKLPTAENRAFVVNSANRFWFTMMGRGIVHPLDLHHADNPPSHPELLNLLADEFAAGKFDVKALLREIALSQAYQRSSRMPAGKPVPAPETFLVAIEKRVSAEQLLSSLLEATGNREFVTASKDPKTNLAALRAKLVKAFASPAREAEIEFNPSLKATLFLLNDDALLSLLAPQGANLAARLTALSDDKLATELYLSVLSRRPTAQESADAAAYLGKNASRRPTAVTNLAWALIASTEFCVNH